MQTTWDTELWSVWALDNTIDRAQFGLANLPSESLKTNAQQYAMEIACQRTVYGLLWSVGALDNTIDCVQFDLQGSKCGEQGHMSTTG